jgi:hypothetical protein
VAQLIEYMQKKGKVWFALTEEIAAHMRSVVASGQHKPMTICLTIRAGDRDKKAADSQPHAG